MHGNLPWNGFIVDEVTDFVDAAVCLYLDKILWFKAQKKGVSIINQRYSKDLSETDFKKRIDFLVCNLEQHRLNNFMGELLQHHTLKSTKYMAKWIEAKNK
ncbi:hypothetical protein D3C87_1666120 [compost metagenome]